ncbi:MAG: non-ribosomal peptide synthetase [Pararhodobacter sp.]
MPDDIATAARFLHSHATFDPASTIDVLFQSQVDYRPEKIALVEGTCALTYRQLAGQVAAIADDLERMHIRKGDIVAILSRRSVELVAAELAILSVGAAFVALDPGHPLEHLRGILDEAAPVALLTHGEQAELAGELATPACPVVDLALKADLDGEAVLAARRRDRLNRPGPGDLAYLIYTSGSTGRPKGVMVPHRGVCRLVRGQNFADLGPEQVVLHMAAVAFDASIVEIYSAVLNGGTLVILPDAAPSLDRIAEVLADNWVTTAHITAGLFHVIAEHQVDALAPLSQVIPCGDVLSETTVNKVLARHRNLRIINGYGPAENTVGTCFHTIDRRRWKGGPVPIGTGLAHDRLFILDDDDLPLPPGEIGQLAVGGAGLALGYLGRPNLTAEKFPHVTFGDFHGRIYLTGDLARIDDEGVTWFHGRVDRQIKINGQRVELDDVEHALRRQTGVEDAAAIPYRGPDGRRQIVAVVASATGNPDALIDRVLSGLRSSVPAAMVPSHVVVRPSLPLSHSGKVDRKRLLEEFSVPHEAAAQPLRPRDAGSVVRAVWQQVLGRSDIDEDRTFFDHGGTSLQLITVHSILQERLNRAFDIALLFELPRLRDLEARLMAPQPEAGALPAADPIAQRRAALALVRSSKAAR